MSYYDMFGWYTSILHPGREAPAPQNTSETTTPGELRANWDGYKWVMMEYVAPPPPPPPVVYVPPAITMRQARLTLLAAGLLDDVEAAINALPEPQKSAAKIEWEYSNEVQRHNGFVSALAPALGLSEAQLDTMFIQGSQI